MIYILLTFFAALFLEIIGTIISIHGLTYLFGIEPLIISMAIGFDFAKLVSVSVLYKEWDSIPKKLKKYLLPAVTVLMIITSAGAAGYLAAASQKALLPTKSIQVKVDALTQEKQKLELRKKEIDNQITNLPPDMVKGRTKLIANFKDELAHVNNRINELDKELPETQIELIDRNSHSGPITYIAEATNTTPEFATGIIIGFIIFVFDPLAVALIILGNYLINKPKIIQQNNEHVEEHKHIDMSFDITDYEALKQPKEPTESYSRIEQDIENNNIDEIVESEKEPINEIISEEIPLPIDEKSDIINEEESTSSTLHLVNESTADVFWVQNPSIYKKQYD